MSDATGYTKSPTQYNALYNPLWIQSMTRLTDQFIQLPACFKCIYVKENFPERLYDRNDWATVTLDCIMDRLAKLSSGYSQLVLDVEDLTKKIGRGLRTFDTVFQVINGIGVKETHWSAGAKSLHIQKFYNLQLKVPSLTIKNIQNEIFQRGPVQSIIQITPQLIDHMDDTVYKQVTPIPPNAQARYSAVRIYGWSVTEGQTPWWLCAPLYAQKRTTPFKVALGLNTGGIESWVWGTNGYVLL